MVGHVESVGEMRTAYTISVENTEGNRLLGGPKLRWEDNTYLLTYLLHGAGYYLKS
jgi:hypothetical protein